VFIRSTSASDPDWSCSCWWHICASSTVRDLGVYVDADITMSAHVTAMVKACFAALCQIRSVRRSLTRTTLLTLVHTLVVTKVDYCSSVLSCISGQLLQWLQSVFNAVARLMFSARKSEHITPLLRELHWPKVPMRIQFRLCVLEYHCINHTATSYLVGPSTWLPTYVHVGVFGVLQHRCWLYRPHDAPLWVIEPSRWLLLERGMLFRHLFVLRHRCCSSAATWRHHCSSHRILFTIVSSCVTDFNIVRWPCNGPVCEVSP